MRAVWLVEERQIRKMFVGSCGVCPTAESSDEGNNLLWSVTDYQYDRGRKGFNYIGKGINGGERVLSAIEKTTDDVVFFSAVVRKELEALGRPDGHVERILQSLENKGRRQDKHGNPWRVYQMNHTLAATHIVKETNWMTEPSI